MAPTRNSFRSCHKDIHCNHNRLTALRKFIKMNDNLFIITFTSACSIITLVYYTLIWVNKIVIVYEPFWS